MIEKFFDKTDGILGLSDKFSYVKNHFTYYTMNSWNGLRSIANNIKLYNLGLTKEQIDKAFELLDADSDGFYEDIHAVLNNAQSIDGMRIGFNGRSGGYLVLYSESGNGSAIEEYFFKKFESYKEMVHELRHHQSAHTCSEIVDETFKTVKRFDEICDEVRATLIYMLEHAKVEEQEVVITRTVKQIVYND
jgi:hypothetical protein